MPAIGELQLLQHLNLAGCNISLNDTQCLSNAMFRLSHLNTLLLGSNRLSGACVGELIWTGFLTGPSRLEELDLRNNWIGEGGAEAIAGLLKDVPSLRVLNLFNTRMHQEDADNILAVLDEGDPFRFLGLLEMCCMELPSTYPLCAVPQDHPTFGSDSLSSL